MVTGYLAIHVDKRFHICQLPKNKNKIPQYKNLQT